MRYKPDLWPLYRGFFVEINMFKASKETAGIDVGNNQKDIDDNKHGLADEDANLMIKLKFLTYKLRTFLIRNGLSTLFKDGRTAYKKYYLSPKNQALIGCCAGACDLVRTEDFLAIVETDKLLEPSSPNPGAVHKKEGLIVFFPGIPGCAKSALCKEILSCSESLEDDRPIYSLMGDLIKGKYWQKVADERRKKPYSIVLADKNAPNLDVWRQGNLEKSSPNVGYVLLMFYHLYDGKNRKEFEIELVERFGSLVKMPLLKSQSIGRRNKSIQASY